MLKHLIRSPVAALTEGVAAVVHGRADGERNLKSPYSGTPCIGFHVSIRAVNLANVLIHDHAQCGDFRIDDGTGTVAIRGGGLDLAITRVDVHAYIPPHPPWLRGLVRPELWSQALELFEGLVQPGSDVLVCGVVQRELGVDNYRDGETSQLAMQTTTTFPLVASTDPDLVVQGDRPIDPQELPRGSGA